MKFLLWVIFALLDQDPDSESGSTDPVESGSNPDPWSATLEKSPRYKGSPGSASCRGSAWRSRSRWRPPPCWRSWGTSPPSDPTTRQISWSLAPRISSYSQIQTEWTRSNVHVACSSHFTMWLVFVETLLEYGMHIRVQRLWCFF